MNDTTATAIADEAPITVDPVQNSAPSNSSSEATFPSAPILEDEAGGAEPTSDETPEQPYIDEDRYKELRPEDAPDIDEPVEDSQDESIPTLWEYLEQTYEPEQLSALSQELAWAHLTNDEGLINVESVQALIDTLVEKPGSVLATDVLGLIAAAEEGKIDLSVANKELEGYDKYREQQQATYEARYTQEAHERSQRVQEFVGSINLPSRINSALDKFGLTPTDDDSRIATEFKNSVHDRIAFTVDTFAARNPHLQTVMEMIQQASQPGKGPTIDDLQSDSIFQISYNRGMQELTDHLGKSLAREALLNKYIKAGYAALNPPTTEQ